MRLARFFFTFVIPENRFQYMHIFKYILTQIRKYFVLKAQLQLLLWLIIFNNFTYIYTI